MKAVSNLMVTLCTLLCCAATAHADVSLNSIRITAPDPLAAGEFYKAAFGLREVNRLNLQGGAVELFLNFGVTDEAALENPNGQIVIMQRGADEPQDGVAHLIFTVTDMDATVAALKSAGGTMSREPFEFGNTGIMIGMALDPAGNNIELIQQP
jgi:predicted enzyme related to lactoylglutathione lyase